MLRRSLYAVRPLPRPLALLVLLAAACSAWRPRPVPAPAPAGAPEAVAFPGRVRVTRADGGRVVLTATRVAGDSLVGDPRGPSRRAAVALGDVRRIDERRPSPRRTWALALGVAAGVALAVGLIVHAVNDADWDFPGGILY